MCVSGMADLYKQATGGGLTLDDDHDGGDGSVTRVGGVDMGASRKERREIDR